MNICDRCKLSLPVNFLTPVTLKNNRGQQKRGYLCNSCKKVIEAQQKGQNNVTNS